MKTRFPKLVCLPVGIVVALLSGCATQPPTNTAAAPQATAGADTTLYVTGSRIGVKNTTELIGVKTIDQASIREDKMWDTNVGRDGK